MSENLPTSEKVLLAPIDWLDPEDRAALPSADPLDVAKAHDLAAVLLMAQCNLATPPASLKQKLMAMVTSSQPMASPSLHFMVDAASGGWMPMKVPGAFAKLLSTNEEKGYAVVLGKLEAGAGYPAHLHQEQEDVFVLEGDLHVGGTHLKAGDFHRAAKGSAHDVNWSDGGCIVMVVISLADLREQLASA